MTIKSKLTLNIVIVLSILAAVVATSIFGMRFISGKLSYLTQKSTPYQMRTLELQREIQVATTTLFKLNSADNLKELQTLRNEAEKAVSQVKNAQETLNTLIGENGTRQEAFEALQSVLAELSDISGNRLKAQEDAEKASSELDSRMKEAISRLRQLDAKIRSLQGKKSGAFSTALSESNRISGQMRGIELARLQLKDLQVAFYEVQHAQKRQTLIISRGKVNAAISRLNQNEQLKNLSNSVSIIKNLEGQLAELQKLQGAWLTQKDDATKGKIDALAKDISEALSALVLTVDQEAVTAGERYTAESNRQGSMFGHSNQANSILVTNSELVSLGLAIQSTATRLFTLKSHQEIDNAMPVLKAELAKAAKAISILDKGLSALGVKEEQQMLRSVSASISGIQTMLFATDGIVAKLNRKFEMEQRAFATSQKLVGIVQKQGQQGKESVTSAQGEQEKAIASVNRIVRNSILVLLITSVVAAIVGISIGIWVFRSVSSPLGQLVKVSENVANGDLHTVEIRNTSDEYGKVLGSMGRMVNNLRDMTGRISGSTNTITTNADGLAATAQELEKNSIIQTAQIEQSVTAMSEMVMTIQDVSQNALATSDAAGSMKSLAIEGKSSLDQTSSELFNFAELVKESVTKIEALGTRSAAINDIVNIIKEIAEQTNLLALNAAIEAARAGEMGAGFAVVADSVRQLSNRTTESANEIATTIKGMQIEVEGSVNSMKKERAAIEKIVATVDTTQQSMMKIVENVEHVFDMVQTIATATEEQSATAEDVNRSMNSINDITRQLSISVEKIKGTSEGFDRLAHELQQMVGWFRL